MKERKKHRSRGKLLDEQDEWMGKEGWQGRCEKGETENWREETSERN